MSVTAPDAIVDLEPWFAGDRDRSAAQLDAALSDVGFAMLVHHGVDGAVLDDARAAAGDLFALPLDAKQRCVSQGPAYRGWFGPGTQSNAATYGIETPPDLKETFATGTERSASDGDDAGDTITFGPNVYPAELPQFEHAWAEMRHQLFGLATTLVDVCEVALDLAPGTMSHHFRGTGMNVVANWYPAYRDVAASAVAGAPRIGPHTDFGTLTLVDRRPSPSGLQVQRGDAWVDVPWEPGCLTLNVGDLMQHWTGGRWPSTLHRIPPPSADHPDEELLSIVAFHRPIGAAVIEPIDGGEPVHCGDWMSAKMAALAVGDS